MTRTATAAAIVAGGKAARLGGVEKGRLVVEGRPIVERQIEVLHRVAADVFIVADAADRLAEIGVPVYADRLPGIGAIGGVYTALVSAASPSVLVVACDLPFLHAGVLARLVELARDGDGAWVRSGRGVEPLLACYRTAVHPRVRARIDAGQLKVADLASTLRLAELGSDELARYGPVDRLLANVNTPEDLARVQLPAS